MNAIDIILLVLMGANLVVQVLILQLALEVRPDE
jgi:hypothetical protein